MFILIGKTPFRQVLEDAMEKVQQQLQGIRSVTDLSDRVKKLREQCETLEIEKGRKQEEFDRKEREVEHKVGLERKRQEVELENTKREATLAVREENLKADRDRFESQMKFHEDRFSEEVKYLKEMIGTLADRLPSATLTGKISGRR